PDFSLGHRALASALARQGQTQVAIAEAEQALRLSGGRDAEARFLLARLYYDGGRLAEAEQSLTDLVAAGPGSPSALLLLGIVKLDLGKTEAGVAVLQKAAKEDPRSAIARLGLAIVQRIRGQLSQARSALEQIIKEQPEWTFALWELGHTLLLQ